MNVSYSYGVPPQLMGALSIFFWIATITIHIAFALAILKDATKLYGQGQLQYVSPGLWGVATLFGGMVTAAIYWTMHHSRLNGRIPMDANHE